MRSPLLALEQITKAYSDGKDFCPALSGISFEVFRNEILCLMGPSGCGKSTVLRIIDGLEQADTGTIRQEGVEKPLLSSMVFQDHALFPWLSVSDNIRYGLTLAAHAVPEEEIRSRVDALLSLTHLESFAHSFPHQLSGGMMQRVSVARALAIHPDIILMDEPFSALDPFTRRELEDEVLRIREMMETTILIVTHSPEEAVYLADRILILSQRPSVVQRIVPVGLPHPRDPADSEFIRIREEVMGSIRGMIAR